MAGSAAEQIRQQTADGRLTAGQARLLLPLVWWVPGLVCWRQSCWWSPSAWQGRIGYGFSAGR